MSNLNNPSPRPVGIGGVMLKTGATNFRAGTLSQPQPQATSAGTALNVDYAIPLLVLTADHAISSVTIYTTGGSGTRKVRCALYQADIATGLPTTLIAQSAETAVTPDDATVITLAGTIPAGIPCMLVLAFTSSGTYPQMGVIDATARQTWLGADSVTGQMQAMVICTRTYGAFPSTYNGVYSAVMPDDPLLMTD